MSRLFCLLALFVSSATWGQATPPDSLPPPRTSASAPAQPKSAQGQLRPTPAAAASVASTDVAGILAQIELYRQTALSNLGALRIEKWKTDGSTKAESEARSQSLSRNLSAALPEMMAQVRSTPDDVPAAFKLYHDLNIVHEVLSGLAESAGAFGPRAEFQALQADLENLDRARRLLVERIESLAASQAAELDRLRVQVKAIPAPPPPPPKKIIVDDDTTPKKPVKKKKPVPAANPSASPGTPANSSNPN